MRTFSRYLLESPLDELPETVDGPHPHERVNTYEEEKDSAIRDENWPPQADLGFTSTHIYQDPDSGIKAHIEMDHATPGWTGRQHPGLGVARCAVEANGMFGDSSITGSRFHMPGEIMGKIASSSSHLHDFITKYKPHTIEYDTDDPKRHALYQHMSRLYPRILFRNTGELKPVERKPKKAVAVSESYSKKQMRVANQTSRNSGAIGKKAITPAYVKTITSKKHKILDFGSGRDAAHTKSLRKSGRNVTAHEFGANVNKNHNPKALKNKYDTVFASNVLNTASSRKMLSDTLDQMHSAVAPGGALVANLPLSPRKSVKVDAKHLMRQLLNRFGDVRRVGGTKKAPLFHAIGPK